MNLASWVYRNFKVHHIQNGEALIRCPKCNKQKFYFNLFRRTGYCHYDKCYFHHHPPGINDLIALAQSAPDSFDVDGIERQSKEVTDFLEVSLPGLSAPLATLHQGSYTTRYPVASSEVAKRGVTIEDQVKFNMRFDGFRVYIPVYFEQKMVQYVGRAAWWFDPKIPRYQYATGAHISSLLFNWTDAQIWPLITLVENTFNAIRWRSFHFTSNFGSHLSDRQMSLLSKGSADSVAILWDKGAEKSAVKAVKKLKVKFGIAAAAGLFEGQPDDYTTDWVLNASAEVHKAAKLGENYINL